MATRVDPDFIYEIKEYGAVGIEKCFNCGNCTAICPLTSDEYPFPRNMIRMVQVGQKESLKQKIDPWLCYYCGECSDTCPRQAEPGEFMASARRYAIASLDPTGISRLLYRSKLFTLVFITILSALFTLVFLSLDGSMQLVTLDLFVFIPF